MANDEIERLAEENRTAREAAQRAAKELEEAVNTLANSIKDAGRDLKRLRTEVEERK
jgi:predicted NBD/HSP70 family sugar kinase